MSEERLKHVAAIRVSNVDKKSTDGDAQVKLCNYTDVYYNDRITGALDFMGATATREQRAVFGLRRGDVLLTKDSETADDIGVSAFVAEDVPNLVCGYHLALVRALSNRALGGYLRWTLASTLARQRMSAAATGVTRFGLRSEAIADLPVPVPPLDTQRAISDYLDRETARIDALIAAKQRVVELLGERWTAVLHAAMTDALGAGDLRPLWSLMTPLEVTNQPDREVLSVYRDHGIIPKASRTDNYNKTPEDLSRYQLVEVGDVVVNKMKAWQGSIGVSEFTGIVSPDYLVCRPFVGTHPGYLHHLLRSPQLRSEYQVRSEGIRPAQWRLQWDGLRLIEIPLIESEAQSPFAARLTRVRAREESARRTLEHQISLLQERRRALITAAVTGQLDIPEAA